MFAGRPTCRLSRRGFLGLAGGAVLLAACGGDDDGSGKAGGTGNTNGGGNVSATTTGGGFSELSPGVVSSDLYASDEPQRFAFAMLAKEGFASGGTARVAVAPPDRDTSAFVATVLHREGLPDNRGVYVAELVLPEPGYWNGVVDYDGDRVDFAFEVKESADSPTIGAAAPTAASPTADDPLGVDPICTADPPCPLHTASLDTLVGAGRPLAVLFAAPARCATQYCGPVLDVLLPLVADHGDALDVVHVEVYRDSRSNELVPTVEEWGLVSEPWFYGIDAAGTITHRLDGAFDAAEMRAVLDALATRA